MEVLLVLDIDALKDKVKFEKHLKNEGFTSIEAEEFAYHGKTSTSLIHTETFILHVCKEALETSDFDTAKLMFQVGENPMKAYSYSKVSNEFTPVVGADSF